MSDAVDDVLSEALRMASAGLDLDGAGSALQDAVEALGKQARRLKEANYEGLDPVSVARALAHTGRVIDDLARLVAFAKGQPDSRPDHGLDWLKALTDEQLKVVQGWMEKA